MGRADKFDLVIKGGDVLDPSQPLRGKRDIGICWGVIEADRTGNPVRPHLEDHRRVRQIGDRRV
jgi:hypothetical protein